MPDLNSLGGTAPGNTTTGPTTPPLTHASSLSTPTAASASAADIPHPQVDAVSHETIPAPVGLPGLVQQRVPPRGPSLAPRPQRIPNVVRYVARAAAARDPHRRSPNFIQHPWTGSSLAPGQRRYVNYLDPPLEVSFALSVRQASGENAASTVLRMRAAWEVAFGSAYVFASTVNLAAVRQAILTDVDWRSAIVRMQFSPLDPSDAASWCFPLPGAMALLPVLALEQERPEILDGRRRLLYAIVTGDNSWREHFAQWVISRSHNR